MEKKDPIRIYVACLAAYNSGTLHGRWIDATKGEDHIWSETKAMLAVSPIEEDAEEWAIHDYEGFEGIRISEYEGFDSIVEYAEFIEEHGTLGAKLVDHCGDIVSAKTTLENYYYGEYESVTDYAEELTQQTTEIPESLRYYIDYKAMARDFEVNDIFTIETGFQEIHVFGSH